MRVIPLHLKITLYGAEYELKKLRLSSFWMLSRSVSLMTSLLSKPFLRLGIGGNSKPIGFKKYES